MDAKSLFDKFLADYVEPRRSAETLTAYTYDLAAFERFLGPCPVSTDALDQYLKHLHNARYASATIERRLQSVRSCLKWAGQRHLTPGPNPFVDWEIPRAKELVPRALSPAEETRLLEALPFLPDDTHMAIRIGRYAALRVGEAARLAWTDIRWHSDSLVVREGKGDQDAELPMPRQNLTDPLRRFWLLAGSPAGGPVLGLRKQVIMRRVRFLFRHLEIPDASYHTLRATYATRLAEAGVHLTTIQRLLRHKDPKTTMRYVAVSDQALRSATELLDLATV